MSQSEPKDIERLLLCTDMDRTVIPNGAQDEPPHARPYLHRLCADDKVSCAYVTGRHAQLVREAIEEYQLPQPDYVITDVGTRIYHLREDLWLELTEWADEIDRDWNGRTHGDLRALFADISALKLQEEAKQAPHKLSYYVDLSEDQDALMETMQQRLETLQIQAGLVWSVDEPAGIGLLDVLPANATKLHAIDFLRQSLSYDLSEVVFAGDSGNDLAVLASAIPSVLVANASEEVRGQALQMSAQQGHQAALYLAGQGDSINGNYAAGVLEGVGYYHSGLYQQLFEEGTEHE